MQLRGVRAHSISVYQSRKVTACTLYPFKSGGVGRGAEMSLTGIHPVWDKILSQNLQAIATQGCHFNKGSSPYKGTAYTVYTRRTMKLVVSDEKRRFLPKIVISVAKMAAKPSRWVV
jgi:hypothetical protein